MVVQTEHPRRAQPRWSVSPKESGHHRDLAAPRIADLVSDPVRVFASSTTCDRLDEVFRSDSTIRCVAVRGDSGGLGLILRDRFSQAMTGPFGFGRALYSRRQVGALADWDPLVLAPETLVEHACQALRRRPPDRGYDDLLVWYADGRIGRVSAAAIFDVVARQCADEAISDPLTSLANRRLFLRSLEEACRQAASGGRRVVVVFIDLDGMKQINDAWGHEAGDAVLIAVARGLRKAVPHHAVVARLGGDEFAVLAQAARGDRLVGQALGERLRRAIAEADPQGAPGLRVRASVGVAISGDRPDAQALLRMADLIMYRAKRSGGDSVAVAE